MASTADFRNGMVLEIEDELYQIQDYQKVHPGKGPAYIKTELKNLDSGGTVRKRFRSGESVNEDAAQRIARLRASPEGQEGIAAFLEKRKASWRQDD